MLYRIENYEQAIQFENWAKENAVLFVELDDGNYVDACPECGDFEFWHSGNCGHCGFSI